MCIVYSWQPHQGAFHSRIFSFSSLVLFFMHWRATSGLQHFFCKINDEQHQVRIYLVGVSVSFFFPILVHSRVFSFLAWEGNNPWPLCMGVQAGGLDLLLSRLRPHELRIAVAAVRS